MSLSDRESPIMWDLPQAGSEDESGGSEDDSDGSFVHSDPGSETGPKPAQPPVLIPPPSLADEPGEESGSSHERRDDDESGDSREQRNDNNSVPSADADKAASESGTSAEHAPAAPPPGITSGPVWFMTKRERRARKLLAKLGLERVPGIYRVTIVKTKRIVEISTPEVYKSPSTDCYIVFGEYKTYAPDTSTDFTAEQHTTLIKQVVGDSIADARPKDPPTAFPRTTAAVKACEEAGVGASGQRKRRMGLKRAGAKAGSGGHVMRGNAKEENLSEPRLDERDVELVMSQTGAPRARAVEALSRRGGDLINAIMDLAE
ncbi:hypothetical protein KEM52_004853 [Ascosphaera acerosa]|nr:hypothetical protein KEM52_004853 [Ascosphaera acerosa]